MYAGTSAWCLITGPRERLVKKPATVGSSATYCSDLGTSGRRIVERDCLIDLRPRNEKYPKQLLTGVEISFAWERDKTKFTFGEADERSNTCGCG
jgi:hypothetical protein